MRSRTPAGVLYTILILISLIITYGLYTRGQPRPKDDVVVLSKKYLGVPYRYGGASPEGFDCSGFIMFMFNQYGEDLPRTADKQAATGIPVSINSLKPGDVLFFSAQGQVDIIHTGLYIGSRKFIHASFSARKVIISNLDEPYWQETFRTARRMR